MIDIKMWGIHAGKLGQVDGMFLEKKSPCIAIGWAEVGDLSVISADREAFKKVYAKTYTGAKKGAIPTSAGMLYRFVHKVEINDYIVYPSKQTRLVHIGRITGKYIYNKTKNINYPNIRSVEWLKTLPRTSYSQGALYEMGSAMTFFQIKNYADEILGLVTGKKPSISVQEDDETIGAVADEIEQSTRDYVQKKITQVLKGHPFEHFVAHLLNLLGYNTRVAPEGPDGGIDIVAYKDELGIEPPIIKVQVKSNDADIVPAKVQALYGNVSAGEYGLFVALSSYSKKAREFAKSKPNLRLIDGNELVDIILTHYEKLDSKYKAVLPLKNVYIPVQIDNEDNNDK